MYKTWMMAALLNVMSTAHAVGLAATAEIDLIFASVTVEVSVDEGDIHQVLDYAEQVAQDLVDWLGWGDDDGGAT